MNEEQAKQWLINNGHYKECDDLGEIPRATIKVDQEHIDIVMALSKVSDAANRVGDRYLTLEAQNKKLGDVVLEMAEASRSLENEVRRTINARKAVGGDLPHLKYTEVRMDHVLKTSADLIKQLKQERES
jgi:hypothetical protein